jgi:dipeptidyl aminopeptidase/acylaminoacyl peptidase
MTSPEATQPPGGETVTIKAADGLEIAGSFYKPTKSAPPWPGVILLHMIYRSREDWEGPAQALAHAGYAVLSIDLRGHGDTGSEADWAKTAEDLKQVWQYFAEQPEVDETRTAFIGASMGANMALWAAAEQSEVKTAVLLSPGLSYFGVETEPAMEGYIGRPLLLIASREDTYSAKSSQHLASLDGDEAELVLYDGASHGTDMFAQESGLINLIVKWLDRWLK